MQIEIAQPNSQQLVSEATELAIASDILIESPDQYSGASEILDTIKSKAKALEEKRVSITKPLDTAKKAVMDLFREPKQILKDAENEIKRRMIGFQQAEEKRRAEAQAKADAIAAKERARLEALAAKERQKAAEKARKLEESGNAAKAALARQQAEIKAQMAEQQAQVVSAVQLRPMEQPKGVSMREVWSGVVVDMHALVGAIHKGIVPITAIQPNMTMINQQARSLKREFNWPGCKAECTQSLAKRAS